MTHVDTLLDMAEGNGMNVEIKTIGLVFKHNNSEFRLQMPFLIVILLGNDILKLKFMRLLIAQIVCMMNEIIIMEAH